MLQLVLTIVAVMALSAAFMVIVGVLLIATTPKRGSQPTIPANPLPPPPAPRPNYDRKDGYYGLPRANERTTYKPTSGPDTPAPWGPNGPAGVSGFVASGEGIADSTTAERWSRPIPPGVVIHIDGENVGKRLGRRHNRQAGC